MCVNAEMATIVSERIVRLADWLPSRPKSRSSRQSCCPFHRCSFRLRVAVIGLCCCGQHAQPFLVNHHSGAGPSRAVAIREFTIKHLSGGGLPRAPVDGRGHTTCFHARGIAPATPARSQTPTPTPAPKDTHTRTHNHAPAREHPHNRVIFVLYPNHTPTHLRAYPHTRVIFCSLNSNVFLIC